MRIQRRFLPREFRVVLFGVVIVLILFACFDLCSDITVALVSYIIYDNAIILLNNDNRQNQLMTANKILILMISMTSAFNCFGIKTKFKKHT